MKHAKSAIRKHSHSFTKYNVPAVKHRIKCININKNEVLLELQYYPYCAQTILLAVMLVEIIFFLP